MDTVEYIMLVREYASSLKTKRQIQTDLFVFVGRGIYLVAYRTYVHFMRAGVQAPRESTHLLLCERERIEHGRLINSYNEHVI
jgi:hypothetical protein